MYKSAQQISAAICKTDGGSVMVWDYISVNGVGDLSQQSTVRFLFAMQYHLEST